MEQTQGDFVASISFNKEELGVLIAGFEQRQSPNCASAMTGYDLAKRLNEALSALEKVESNPLARLLADRDGLDSLSFPTIPQSSRTVDLPNGTAVAFFDAPDGGAVWNGQFDENMPGPNGYTYGYVVIDGQIVNGYVCHATGQFRTGDEEGQRLISQQPELSLEERAERAGVGVVRTLDDEIPF